MGKTLPYFEEWMAEQTVNYKAKVSMNGVGQITYASDPTELDCYIHGTRTRVVNDKNEEVISNQQIYLDGSDSTVASIDFGDVFSIGSDRYRQILSIDKFYDEDGDLDLVVVYL
jgi:hypothetical protein